MTGFGKSELIQDNKTITIEIRTLNSKTIDINSRLPYMYKEFDMLLRKKIADSLKRGKIDFSVVYKSNKEDSNSVVNKEIVESYISQLKDIRGFQESDLLSIAMKLPETPKTEKNEIDEEGKSSLLILLDETLSKVVSFRNQEGETLFNDFMNRSKLLKKYLGKITKVDNNRKKIVKERINSEIKKLKVEIDQNRLS